GRNRKPQGDVRAVLGIRGEPSTPQDAAKGEVWTSITNLIDTPGAENDYISVSDLHRERFARHPWSLQGGGAVELKHHVGSAAQCRLESRITALGFASFPGLDDCFVRDERSLERRGVPANMRRKFITGESLRDWASIQAETALVPYDNQASPLDLDVTASWARELWRFRTSLGAVTSFGGKTRAELGDSWWLWYRWVEERYRTPLSITFASVATHNHFVLDRGGKVFNRTAPVIKLPQGASEDDHLALLGLLN